MANRVSGVLGTIRHPAITIMAFGICVKTSVGVLTELHMATTMLGDNVLLILPSGKKAQERQRVLYS